MKSKNLKPLFLGSVVLVCATIVLTGCAVKIPISNLENAYGTGFRSLTTLSDEEIKQRGASRDLPSFTQDEIWNASLAVAMQRGPIVRADETKKRITSPPYALLLENREQHMVLYCAYMDELHYNSKNPKQELFRVRPEEKRQFVEEVLDRVVTQASVRRNLGPNGKWNWLPE